MLRRTVTLSDGLERRGKPDMDDPFESPKSRIDWAKTSINELEPMCTAFVQRCTYEEIRSTDPKTGEHIVKLRFHQQIPPTMQGLAVHALDDLRHALDQAVVAAAILLGRTHGRGVYFPFGKTAKNLDDETAIKCKGVDPELVKFIRGFNAYYRANDLLYALGSLSGPNKHQKNLRVSFDSAGVKINASGKPWALSTIGATGPSVIGGNRWNALRNELELKRFAKGTTGDIDASPVLQIVIGTGEPPLSGPAATVFREFARIVERIILDIEAETKRILASRA